MSNGSKCQLGAFNVQRFSERINSAANLIVTKEKVSLDFAVSDKLMTLWMNKSFIIFVKNNKNRGNINFITGLDEMVDADEEVWYQIQLVMV